MEDSGQTSEDSVLLPVNLVSYMWWAIIGACGVGLLLLWFLRGKYSLRNCL
ncbi:hypothetical protein BaRGS_00007299, partial [Batillaria attramentaria]